MRSRTTKLTCRAAGTRADYRNQFAARSGAAPCSPGRYFSSFGRPGQTLLGLMIRVMFCIIIYEFGISVPEFSIITIVIRSDGR